ncbi:MAG: DUF2007 domain-containing protein [Planctomycetota bacterium]
MTRSASIEAVARVAATLEQAKVFVALLQAEGIPARIEGDSLVDEFATARKMMNLMSTRVMVPTNSVEAAREILQPANIDTEELARQALAEPRQDAPPLRVVTTDLERTATRGRAWLLLLVPLFVGLWLAAS